MRARFGPFTFDTGTRQLLKQGAPIRLSPKAFDALALLIESRPNVVGKDAFDDRLWRGVFVSDANRSVLISEIRRALGDTPRSETFVRTVDRVGYAFVGEVLVAAEEREGSGVRDRSPGGGSVETVHCRLVWTGGHVTLGTGEHVIGRNPMCHVWLDVEGVSRKHARIRIDGSHRAAIEDLGSTNGTFLHGRPIEGPMPLADGDVIQVGTAELTFRAWTDKPTRRIRRS
jgi:DNA-binding winged helix-turn-helix (wHTH) protein